MAINSRHMTNDSSTGTSKETASGQFTSIPILSLERARNPVTKPAFLSELRDALLNVGFLYLSDTGLPLDLIQRVKNETFKFFDESILPLEEKERIEMKNEKSFLGWSRVSTFHN
jgi:isopenicillin N synthase-like dioxygenase